MRRLLLLLLPLFVGVQPAEAQVPAPWSEGTVILQSGDTLRGPMQVDLPGNQVLVKWPPQGERGIPAVQVKYVGLRVQRMSRQFSGNLFGQIESRQTAHYISAPCDQTILLFEVLETGPRVVLLYHPRAGTVGWRQADPHTALLRRDWFDPPTEGFYLGYLSTNRVVPFRCSLPGLLRVLPDYHAEIKQYAWQHPTLTVGGAIGYYNSLSPNPYYERREAAGKESR